MSKRNLLVHFFIGLWNAFSSWNQWNRWPSTLKLNRDDNHEKNIIICKHLPAIKIPRWLVMAASFEIYLLRNISLCFRPLLSSRSVASFLSVVLTGHHHPNTSLQVHTTQTAIRIQAITRAGTLAIIVAPKTTYIFSSIGFFIQYGSTPTIAGSFCLPHLLKVLFNYKTVYQLFTKKKYRSSSANVFVTVFY